MSRPRAVLFSDAIVRRIPGGDVALSNFEFALHEGDAWAITGPVGSGKTTIAETIAGRHRVAAGVAEWPIANGAPPSNVISLVGFREDSRAFSYRGKYYQQRYEFVQGDDEPVTLRSFLGRDRNDEWLNRFDILRLLDQAFVTLSNGQVRKARIAKSLAAGPKILILDDPFVGLDVAARADLNALLKSLHDLGQTIILIARDDHVPEWITRRRTLGDITNVESSKTLSFQTSDEIILDLDRVTVRHGQSTLLRDLSWTVRRGERWSIVGPNGSGKTTLLSLVCGDHPQAFSQRVTLFGHRRGSGESVWDVKARVGLVSPEMHLTFPAEHSVREAIASGFRDTLVAGPVSQEQLAAIDSVAAKFGLSSLLDRPFARLSSGEQRLTLLARSLVKRPELIIWDEPFQCLDRSAIHRVQRCLAESLSSTQTFVMVTHDEVELPTGMTNRLRLTPRSME